MSKKSSAILQRLIFSFFLFILQIFFLLPAYSMPPEQVVNAARKGLKSFLAAIPPQDLNGMGFLDQSEVDNALLGEGFQVYAAHPNNVSSYAKKVADSSSMVIPTNEWQFLIVTNDQARSILTVDRMQNEWKAVAVGAAGLARQLAKIVEKYPAHAGYSHKFIKVFQPRSDFVEISHQGKPVGVVPLTSGRVALGLKQPDLNVSDLFDFRDIISRIDPGERKKVETKR